MRSQIPPVPVELFGVPLRGLEGDDSRTLEMAPESGEDLARGGEVLDHLAGGDHVEFPLAEVVEEPFPPESGGVDVRPPDLDREMFPS